ncbi:MAG: response regulator [Candidatus Omnitrophica bacterium]|nr:response regulator [Candidatus Omnitrophota bacterium]
MSKKVLVVDDEQSVVKVVVFRIRKAGYEVVSANDGESALKVLKDYKPDLILLDIALPDIDGYEVSRRIRLDESTKSIPIIFFSASTAMIMDKSEVLNKYGVQGYISKPFETKELLQSISNIIGDSFV